MKIKRLFFIIFTFIFTLNLCVSAEDFSVKLTDDLLRLSGSISASESYYDSTKENSVSVNLPKEYNVVTVYDTDKEKTFFNNLPIKKKDIQNNLEQFGVILNAFSKDKSTEIRISIFVDEFSKNIKNLSTLESDNKQEIISSFKNGIDAESITLLSDVTISNIKGVDYLKYYARKGNEKSGYSFMKAITVIGGVCYEISAFSSVSKLTQEITDKNHEILASVKFDIKNSRNDITANTIKLIFYVVILVAALVLVGFTLFSIINQLKNKDDEEIVKIKKR